jgi:hypothetical protein
MLQVMLWVARGDDYRPMATGGVERAQRRPRDEITLRPSGEPAPNPCVKPTAGNAHTAAEIPPTLAIKG